MESNGAKVEKENVKCRWLGWLRFESAQREGEIWVPTLLMLQVVFGWYREYRTPNCDHGCTATTFPWYLQGQMKGSGSVWSLKNEILRPLRPEGFQGSFSGP